MKQITTDLIYISQTSKLIVIIMPNFYTDIEEKLEANQTTNIIRNNLYKAWLHSQYIT